MCLRESLSGNSAIAKQCKHDAFIFDLKGQSGSKHESRAKWGYFSDIISGPHICHGVYTEDASFYQKNNMRYIKVQNNHDLLTHRQAGRLQYITLLKCVRK